MCLFCLADVLDKEMCAQ